MANICDFDRILKTECSLQHFTRNYIIKNLDEMKQMRQTLFVDTGLLNVKEKGMAIYYIMNKCFVMFLRGGKVNIVQY